LNDNSRNCLLGHRKKILTFLMKTFTCRSTFLFVPDERGFVHGDIALLRCGAPERNLLDKWWNQLGNGKGWTAATSPLTPHADTWYPTYTGDILNKLCKDDIALVFWFLHGGHK
jgi:hypothetical protein